MTELTYLARSKTTAVWGVLIAATLLSWRLGAHAVPALSDTQGGTGSLIIAIAFVKVRFVGAYFMELRDAPTALRAVFEGYCVVVCLLLMGMLLLA
jgi:hypothetical protein